METILAEGESVGVCSECGSDVLWAWYAQPERQTIEVIVKDGVASYDYTGCTESSFEAGEDEEYLCSGCQRITKTIEEMVGLPPEQSANADSCVTCDFMVPVTVTVDLSTGKPVAAAVHLDGFQSAAEGAWVKLPADADHGVLPRVFLRAAYIGGRLVPDGEDPVADLALAIADQVRPHKDVIEIAFNIEESA